MAIFQSRTLGASQVAPTPPADPPAPPGGSPPPQPPAPVASDIKVSPNPTLVWASVAGLLIAYFVAFKLSEGTWDPDGLQVPQPLAEGVGLFALIYVFAQAIERLLEPVSLWVLPTAELTKDRDEKVAEAEKSAADEAAAKAAADAQAMLDRQRANRAIVFWGIASVVGIFAAASMKLYLLHIMGQTTAPRWAEILTTGLVIGAGTKPVHDLITRLQTASKASQDPPQTGGTP